MVKAVPDGFGTVTPYLVVDDGGKALEFYEKAFGAEVACRVDLPGGGGLMYGEVTIGNSRVTLAEECPGGPQSAKTIGGTPVTIHLYVDDCDALYQRAVDAGAEAKMPLTDMFWGDRYGQVVDPFGHSWSIATHKEDLTPEQIGERAAAMFASGECGEQK